MLMRTGVRQGLEQQALEMFRLGLLLGLCLGGFLCCGAGTGCATRTACVVAGFTRSVWLGLWYFRAWESNEVLTPNLQLG